MLNAITLSVIIPTFNRCGTLLKCLESIRCQSDEVECLEVVVVDDGSSDETADHIRRLIDVWKGCLKYVYQSNRGPAAARNVGASVARGEILLFLGDDIIATPHLLQHHIAQHRQNAALTVAVLGKTIWSPTLELTPLMRWLDEQGLQFDYASLEHKTPTIWHFYTSNISLKRQFFAQHGGFDEDFRYAAFEDVELAMRLDVDGLRIVYQSAALAYHDHPTTFASHLSRIGKVGVSACILEHKHPGVIARPKLAMHFRIRRRALLALGPIIALIGSDQMQLRVHQAACDRMFWRCFDQQAALYRIDTTL